MTDLEQPPQDGAPPVRRPVPFGPYRAASGGLTGEGRDYLAAWLGDWPAPAKLLCSAYRRVYAAALASGLDVDELNAVCAAAAAKALLTFDPATGHGFASYAAQAMRFAVQDHLRVEGRARRHGVTVTTASQVAGEDDGWLAAAAVARECPEGERGELCRAVSATLGRVPLPHRQREVLALRYGFAGRTHSLAEVGERLGVSKERVRQIEVAAMTRTKPHLDRLYRDHCIDL